MRHLRSLGWSARLLVALAITVIIAAHVGAAEPARASARLDGYVVVIAGPAQENRTDDCRVSYRLTADGDKPDGNVPAWPFALGTIAAVAAGAFWAMRRRR